MKKYIFLVFLIISSINVYSLEINHNVINLWTNASESSFWYNWNVAQDIKLKNGNINAGLKLDYLDAKIQNINSSIINTDLQFAYKTSSWGIKSNLGFLYTPEIKIKIDDTYKFQNVKEFNGNIELNFHCGNFQFFPFVAFSTLNSENGDLYWFYGDLYVPFVGKYGIKTKYKNHYFKVYYLGGMANIVNSDDSKLINSAENNISCTYLQKWNYDNFQFVPYMTYNFTFCDFTGELNDKNQNYLVFPYKKYKINGNVFAHYIQTGMKFNHSAENFDININFDTLFFLNQTGNANLSWKYKKNLMFDGSSGTDCVNIDLLNLKGLMSIYLNGIYHLKINNFKLDLGISKDFLIPIWFSADKWNEDSSESLVPNDFSSELIWTYIFSGLGIYCKFLI